MCVALVTYVWRVDVSTPESTSILSRRIFKQDGERGRRKTDGVVAIGHTDEQTREGNNFITSYDTYRLSLSARVPTAAPHLPTQHRVRARTGELVTEAHPQDNLHKKMGTAVQRRASRRWKDAQRQEINNLHSGQEGLLHARPPSPIPLSSYSSIWIDTKMS